MKGQTIIISIHSCELKGGWYKWKAIRFLLEVEGLLLRSVCIAEHCLYNPPVTYRAPDISRRFRAADKGVIVYG